MSYTQRLERRIKDLEEQLAYLSKSPSSAPVSSPQSNSSATAGPSRERRLSKVQDDSNISRSFSGLKVDDKGRITYHGATSFFQLPGDQQSSRIETSAISETDREKRDRLVNNAWQQRALENLSETPVSAFAATFLALEEYDTDFHRNHSSIFCTSTGAGSSLSFTSYTVQPSPVSISLAA